MTTHVTCMAFRAPRHTSALPFQAYPPFRQQSSPGQSYRVDVMLHTVSPPRAEGASPVLPPQLHSQNAVTPGTLQLQIVTTVTCDPGTRYLAYTWRTCRWYKYPVPGVYLAYMPMVQVPRTWRIPGVHADGTSTPYLALIVPESACGTLS
jgi:hypothetical protein